MCGSCTDPGGQSDGGGEMLLSVLLGSLRHIDEDPYISFYVVFKKKKKEKRCGGKEEEGKNWPQVTTRVPTTSSREEKLFKKR